MAGGRGTGQIVDDLRQAGSSWEQGSLVLTAVGLAWDTNGARGRRAPGESACWASVHNWKDEM